MDDKRLADVASDAVSVLTSALYHRQQRMSEQATRDYHRDIKAVLEGKSGLELAVVIATLGDIAVEMLRAIAAAQEIEPEELLRELALVMRQSWVEGS